MYVCMYVRMYIYIYVYIDRSIDKYTCVYMCVIHVYTYKIIIPPSEDRNRLLAEVVAEVAGDVEAHEAAHPPLVREPVLHLITNY